MLFAARERYEPQLAHLARFVSVGMTVIDAGANLGAYTVAAGHLVGASGRVLAFEPGRESYDVLTRNIALNCLPHVQAFRAALADCAGDAALYHHFGPNSYSLAPPAAIPGVWTTTVTVTLDDVLAQHGIDEVHFIKLDVEGAEELVVRGAEDAIKRSLPTIMFEIYRDAAMRLELAEVGAWERLKQLGYEFYDLDLYGVMRPFSAAPADGNVLAIHRDGDATGLAAATA